MKTHTQKAYIDVIQSRPVIMKTPEILRDTVKLIEIKRGVTLTKEMK